MARKSTPHRDDLPGQTSFIPSTRRKRKVSAKRPTSSSSPATSSTRTRSTTKSKTTAPKTKPRRAKKKRLINVPPIRKIDKRSKPRVQVAVRLDPPVVAAADKLVDQLGPDVVDRSIILRAVINLGIENVSRTPRRFEDAIRAAM